MDNLSLPLFRFAGGIRLKVEPSRVEGMARLSIHDDGEAHAVGAQMALALGFNDYFKPGDGTQGAQYAFQFKARSGCDPVYYFSLFRGALPPGLTRAQPALQRTAARWLRTTPGSTLAISS